MTVQRQIDRLITQRAGEWLGALKTGGARERAEFVQWIAESPRHISEFLALVALERELRSMELSSHFDVQALLAKVSPQVTPLRTAAAADTTGSISRFRAWRWTAAIAAGVSILAFSFILWSGEYLAGQRMSTAVGEQRSVELPDGSVMYLNAASQVRVRFDGSGRSVRLLGGEALFEVAPDTQRPFRVYTHDAVVQALGTQFNVYAREDGTKVSVLEGKVQVSTRQGTAAPAALGAGEAAQVGSIGKIERTPRANVTNDVAWRQRRLVFDKTPLEDVVREFNRYNQSLRLRLEGIEPGSHHYSGNFDASDPQSLAALIAREPDVTVETANDEIVIRARH